MSGAEGVVVGACIATAACVAVWTLRRLWRDVGEAIWEENLQASTAARVCGARRVRPARIWEGAA